MRIDFYVALAGAAAGFGSGILFQWVNARIPRVDFWLPAAHLARSLVAAGDDEDFFVRYRELLNLLMRYLGRQALTMGLPLICVALFAMLILPQSADRPDQPLAEGGSIWRRPVRLANGELCLKGCDLPFLLPLCVGYGVVLIMPRRKE